MLDLLIFVPCDKVIVAERGQSSVIGVLEQIIVGITKDAKLTPDAMIPYKWSILILWHRTEEVVDPITCIAKVILLRPDNGLALNAEAEFEVSNSFRNFRQNVDLPLMPAGVEGDYLLKLSLKKGSEDFKDISTFPIRIEHKLSDVQIESAADGQSVVRITNADKS